MRVHDGARGRIDHALLHEREAEALQHAALDLAARLQRRDDAADVVHGDDALDRDLARRDVDGDLRDLAAERVHAHAVGVRAARAGADELRLAELAGDLDDRLAQRAVERDELAVDDLEVVRRDLEDVAGELEQLAAQVVGRRAHGGRDRRHRLRAARDRARRRRSASSRPRRARGRAAARAPRRRPARTPSSRRCRCPARP